MALATFHGLISGVSIAGLEFLGFGISWDLGFGPWDLGFNV
jgi:hypothetical protein